MKRSLVILLIIVGITALLGTLAWVRLPSIATFLLGQAIGGRMEAGQSTVSWSRGAAVIELDDIALSGGIKGTVKRTRLEITMGRGLYIRFGAISDFDVIIEKERLGGRFVPLQIEYAEIVRGRAVYKGQTFTINNIKVRNFNTKGQFEISVDGGIEGLGKIKTKGSGTLRNGRSDIRGTYVITQFDLSRLFPKYQGYANSRGEMIYRAGELDLQGTAGADRFVMKEAFLKKPLEVSRVDCAIHIYASEGKIKTKLGKLSFRGTPLSLVFTTNGRKLEKLKIVSGAFNVRDILEYISLSFTRRLPHVMGAVTGGKVTLQQFVYAKPDTFEAGLFLENIEIQYKGVQFEGVTGHLRLYRDGLILADLKAVCGNTVLSGVSGSVPFSERREIGISGKYELDLADLSRFIRTPDLKIASGLAEGVAEIRGKGEDDMRVQGAGKLKGSVLSWKGLPFTTAGSFRFDNNGITCSPCLIKKSETEFAVQGTVAQNTMDLKIDGQIDTAHAGRLCSFPYALGGPAGVNGRVEGKNGEFLWTGIVSMEEVSFDIPGFMSKNAGTPSIAEFRAKALNDHLLIEHLLYTLGDITIQVAGKADRNHIANLRIDLDAPHLDRSSSLFEVYGIEAKGEIRAGLDVYDLKYRLAELPRATGYATVRKGFLSLPSLPEPIDEIDVTCDFQGDRYQIEARGIRAGTSSVETAKLLVEAAERPRISLAVKADNFDPKDILEPGKPWRISSINQDSVLSRVSADISLQARHVQWGRVGLDGLHAKLGFEDSKLSLLDWGAEVFGGTARAEGRADFSEAKPRFGLAGKLDGISWNELFRAIKGDVEIMQGDGMARISLESQGEDAREIVEGLSGHVMASSTDGVIRKWNILSKIFGFLNLYELLQGKVNLAKEGLPYSMMSAEFSGKNGIFKTDNFMIDSPSMKITGKGSVTLMDRTVDGSIAVSPLVTIDAVLDKIPIIRNVLKDKKQGFLFVVYNISGSLHDPEIYSTYVESIGMRAYLILRNFIFLPSEVMKP